MYESNNNKSTREQRTPEQAINPRLVYIPSLARVGNVRCLKRHHHQYLQVLTARLNTRLRHVAEERGQYRAIRELRVGYLLVSGFVLGKYAASCYDCLKLFHNPVV